MELKLIYASKRGASIIRSQPRDEDAIKKAMGNLCKRHIEARLLCDNEPIGFVFKQDRRWVWFFDPHFVRD